MKNFLLFLSISSLFFACSSSNSIMVQTEMLAEAQPSNSVEEVTVYNDRGELDASSKELASLSVQLFEEEDPEQKIIESFQRKAKEIGANGILITKNEPSVQAKRDMQKGGITTGINRDMKAIALLIQ